MRSEFSIAPQDRSPAIETTATKKTAPLLALFALLAASPACLETHERGERKTLPVEEPPEPLPPVCTGYARSRLTHLTRVLGRHVWKHDAPVTALAVSPDGKRLFSSAADGTVKVWEIATARELVCFTPHPGPEGVPSPGEARCLAVSPDGKRILVGGERGALGLFEAGDGTSVRDLSGHEEEVTAVAFLGGGGGDEGRPMQPQPGERALSASRDGRLIVWDLDSGEKTRTFEKCHPHGIWSLAVSPDGSLALSGGQEGKVKVFELATGRELRTIEAHKSQVSGLSFLPDGWRFLSASHDGTVRAFEVSTGKELGVVARCESAIVGLAVSPDGKDLLAASSTSVLRFSVTDGLVSGAPAPTRTVDLGREARAVVLLRDGEGFSGSADGTVASTRPASKGAGHRGAILCMDASRAGDLVLTGSDDQTLRLWRAERRDALRVLAGHKGAVTACALLPDGAHAISTSADGAIKVWDLETGEDVWTCETGWAPNALAVEPSGWSCLVGRSVLPRHTIGVLTQVELGKTPEVHDKKVGTTLRDLFAGERKWHEVTAVAVSPDGRTACTGGPLGLEIWNIDEGKLRAALEGHGSAVDAVALSRSGRLALTGSRDRTVLLWDLAGERSLVRMKGHEDAVVSVVFSPDEKLAVSASRDRTIRFFDVARGGEVDAIDLSSSGERPTRLAFTGDGRALLVATSRGVVLRFDLNAKR